MTTRTRTEIYFPYHIQIAEGVWQGLKPEFETLRRHAPQLPPMMVYRTIAAHLNKLPEAEGRWVPAGHLNLYALMSKIFRYLTDRYLDEQYPGLLDRSLAAAGYPYPSPGFTSVAASFCALFPNAGMMAGTETPAEYLAGDDAGNIRKKTLVKEFILLTLAAENRAIDNFRLLVDDTPLAEAAPYRPFVGALDRQLAAAPPYESLALPLLELLRLPLRACPDSLSGQMEFIKSHWAAILPPDLLSEILTAFDIMTEEEREYWGAPGPPEVLEFGLGAGGKGGRYGSLADDHYPEPEAFSQDADWMSNVVLLAKMVYVWLDQLTKKYGRPINRLDEIPDWELDRLQRWGFTGLWLIGIWERSPASQKIKHLCGNHDAVASAYSLYDYVIAADLGGQPALEVLRDKCRRRGIRLSARHGPQPYRDLLPVGPGASRLVRPARLPAVPDLHLQRPGPLLRLPHQHQYRGRLLAAERRGGGLQALRTPHRPDPLHLPRQRRHQHPLERYGPAQLPHPRGAGGGHPDHHPRGAATSPSSASTPP